LQQKQGSAQVSTIQSKHIIYAFSCIKLAYLIGLPDVNFKCS